MKKFIRSAISTIGQYTTGFSKRLQAVLPATCCPIMLTDAGFHTPRFRSVEALGWDWIGRHRGRIMIRIDRPHAAWCSVSTYYDKAPIKSESLGICDITRSRPTSCYLVRTRRRPKVRHQTRRDRRRAGRKRWPRDIESPGCWLRPAGWRTKARPRLRDFTGCACRSRPRFVISSPINMAARSRTHRPGSAPGSKCCCSSTCWPHSWPGWPRWRHDPSTKRASGYRC